LAFSKEDAHDYLFDTMPDKSRYLSDGQAHPERRGRDNDK